VWTEKSVDTDILIVFGQIAGCMAVINIESQGLDVLMVDEVHARKSGASIRVDLFMSYRRGRFDEP